MLGGSFARVCKKKGIAKSIVGFGRNETNLIKAANLGIIDKYSIDLNQAVDNADFVLLATPIGSLLPLVRSMIPSLKKESIVSDVGSVKGRLVTDLENALPDDVYFVGAHPIAGTEKSGADNSFAELFEGAKCILTPTGVTNKNALNMVKEIWKIMGSEIIEMDPHNHDKIMAAVSHLPHVIAYAITSLMLELQQEWPNILSYSGAGFRDFTRIASSHPAIWRDICEHNSKALIKTIERYETTLSQFKNLIKEKNWLVLEKTMADAKNLRDNFYAGTKNK